VKATRTTILAACLALHGCVSQLDPRQGPEVSGRVVSARTGVPLAARVYYQDAAHEVVVAGGDGRFKFPSVRKSYSEMVGLDRMPVRWLVVEAKAHKQAMRKVDQGAPGVLLIELEPNE